MQEPAQATSLVLHKRSSATGVAPKSRTIVRDLEMDATLWLQNVLLSLCDGEWEHGSGIRLETLDNPGWAIFVGVEGTDLEGKAFQPISVRRTETDWIDCRIEGTVFRAFCGASNLDEMIQILRDWNLCLLKVNLLNRPKGGWRQDKGTGARAPCPQQIDCLHFVVGAASAWQIAAGVDVNDRRRLDRVTEQRDRLQCAFQLSVEAIGGDCERLRAIRCKSQVWTSSSTHPTAYAVIRTL